MPPIDFESAVRARSQSVPVLVDFWAPWCGPCRMLGPALEELAASAAGRWELVKLNTDEQPDVAEDYGIRGIPAVKLFHRGEVIAEFVGALGREDVRRWLDANLPDARLERLEAIMAQWPDRGPALADELERFVAEQPDLALGRLRLAQTIVTRDPARARELAHRGSVEPELADLADDVESLAELVENGSGAPEAVASHLAGARTALREHDLDRALEHLVDAAMRNKSYRNELARRVAVALFRLLGQDHELTRKHQRRLAMAIHT